MPRTLTPEQKEHSKLKHKEYYQKHKEELRNKAKTRRLENIEAVREYDRKRAKSPKRKAKMRAYSSTDEAKNKRRKRSLAQYDLTPEAYNEMFKAQEGKCLICGTHQSDLNKPLFVDHDHETGKVRGLLCHHCNALLGYAFDNVFILERAKEYLQDAA